MVLANYIMSYGRSNKITWNKTCSLVNKLVECMLAIGSGLAPYNRAGRIIDNFSVSIHMLAITFHISLLKICGKTMHILIVGKYCFCGSVKKIEVPYTYQSHQDWNIFVESSFSKMIINFVGSF